MKSFFFVLSQLTLVTIVYVFAYRTGYRAAQSKAMSVVRKFADPVTSLLDQLSDSIEEATEDDADHPTASIKYSTLDKKSQHLPASDRSNKKTNADR